MRDFTSSSNDLSVLPSKDWALAIRNQIIEYRVNQDQHPGWFVDEFGYWRHKCYSNYQLAELMRRAKVHFIGDQFAQYSLPFYRQFLPAAYR